MIYLSQLFMRITPGLTQYIKVNYGSNLTKTFYSAYQGVGAVSLWKIYVQVMPNSFKMQQSMFLSPRNQFSLQLSSKKHNIVTH